MQYDMIHQKAKQQGLDDEQMEEIKEAFNLFDTEGKQVIDVRELKVSGMYRRFIIYRYNCINVNEYIYIYYCVIQILLCYAYIIIYYYKYISFLGCIPSLGFPS